jgi:uncharacterized protein (DUF1684 family)
MRAARTASILLGAVAAAALMPASAPRADDPHTRDIEGWRKQRVARLNADDGWLVVAGLFWLKPGDNSFGSDPKGAVVLPGAPARAGVLRLEGKGAKKVTVEVAAGVPVTLDGKPVAARRELRPDVPGPPDVLALGSLRFFVIERDGEVGIRLRDLKSPRRPAFKGIQYFPISAAYKVVARYEAYPKPKTISVPNVLGKTSEVVSPGVLRFRLGDHDLSLDAVLEEPEDTRLFLIFKDKTAGAESYGGGRFLYTEGMPSEGHVTIDFNKAYTPPCGFTPFATCPLAPPQNRLPIRIEAGEKYSGPHP